ncbi:MAG: hypothetical protein A2504_07925 [Bdellovibrionales bacterium RIFOXYD12_FULL_39_22]|nr:MAG: hypothetical protein A2385_13550 [Bdellovibrionales bacterium RIFOXYB1_FULL_39_21]OFZ44858.1 MAG: hypothetical protein A2485_14760 [Bdellovibrionales bacterium RIFOXYC12_FULL_39_17]OFZ49376.1 MAG: hypothetical protein A2404_09095 [Bdellovibrionales bacterium RIFOXYC1_FULL_39_130]OFZ69614.1 MAG: hypothetical protein A2451_06660 [Bdellovibrionales bacterium RIFOXYC2_FULL_39_8]OFZ77097.1 MAG: hypothetical protein A2560_10745 [Bdellovibrionales bacterium RIFOXYD1_FULL_39_84]OFZ95558.1 MAG:
MAFTVMFYCAALFTLYGAAMVAFSKNIIYSAFSLLISFIGVVVIYALLDADFLAIAQLVLYVGGILVLILFAIMLTNKISNASSSNPSRSQFLSFVTVLVIFVGLFFTIIKAPWQVSAGTQELGPITDSIGDALLTKYLLPFEIVSVLLLVGLIGAVVIARKENIEKAGNTNLSATSEQGRSL